jgi:hypothetical protein
VTDKAVSTLTAANALSGTELLYGDDGAADVKITATQIKTFCNSGSRERLTADRNYYVRTDGSDSNTGLANTAGASFLTIQKAVDVVCNDIDLGDYLVTINVAAGNYAEEVTVGDYVGGNIIPHINPNSPFNELTLGQCRAMIKGAGATSVIIGVTPTVNSRLIRFYNSAGSPWFMDSMAFSTTNFQDAIEIGNGANVYLGNMDFLAPTSDINVYCIYAPAHCNVEIDKFATITFHDDWWTFIAAYDGAHVKMWEHCEIEFTDDVEFGGAFIECSEKAEVYIYRVDAVTLNGHAVTGIKWISYHGGWIRYSLQTGGVQSLNSLPGSVNGYVSEYGDGDGNTYVRGLYAGTPANPTIVPTLGHINGLAVGLTGVTYSNRPSTPAAGMVIYVTDSNTATWGATIAGGSTFNVLGWYNGTNWTVSGA